METTIKTEKDNLDLCQLEVDNLWHWYEVEKDKIIREEYEKDAAFAPDDIDNGIYYDNYLDHWRVDELHSKVCKMEDKIYEKYEDQTVNGK